jgi:hypothetical protein
MAWQMQLRPVNDQRDDDVIIMIRGGAKNRWR